MVRKINIQYLENSEIGWDLLVIGGGATGLGLALDGALRGYKTLLLEAGDFASGTSSRSTKLIHGGIRYLAKGDIGLVIEALHERDLLLKNAPGLARVQDFIIPCYVWWELPFYAIGIFFYDLLAGKRGVGRSAVLSKKSVLKRIPTLNPAKLKGGVLYHDGQFDDARFAMELALAASQQGACLLNYFPVTGLIRNEQGKTEGVACRDLETGKEYTVKAGCIINATGVFADAIFRMNDPQSEPVLRPSQGVHLVLDNSFLPGNHAIMIPHTKDGRVLFAIPWHDRVVVGTTDTPVDQVLAEPNPLQEEIEFILESAENYLVRKPGRADILSVFAGLRPLAAASGTRQKTKEISRRHKIIFSASGLITIIGGKWTTYRRMAKDGIDAAIRQKLLPPADCKTMDYVLHDSHQPSSGKTILLDHRFPYTEEDVRRAVREEMALKLVDVLARRTRLLFLDVKASLNVAGRVAEIMAQELGKDDLWINIQLNDYKLLSDNYIIH